MIAVVAAAVAALVLGLSGGSSRPQRPFTPVVAAPPPLAPVAPVAPQAVNLTLPPGQGVVVAEVLRPTAMRASPGGRVLARLGTHTGFGSPEYLWVVRSAPAWLGVVSPLVGNGRLGWIPQSATVLGRVKWQLKVSLSARSLTVLMGGRVVRRYTVSIGAPQSPTPTGRFAVTDRLRTADPGGPYGCCILALSAVTPHVVQGWDGGDRIAIHTTPDTSTIGEAVSHGCVRVPAADGRWLLMHVPLATPTVISS